MTPEHDSFAFILGIAENLVQVDGKAVQVSNVKRTKVGVECIVEKGVVNGEIHRG